LTGSPGGLGQFFLKNQNDIVLVKKNQRVATGFLTGSCRVTPGFSFPYFFFNPAWFQTRVGRVPDRPAGLGQAGFQNYDCNYLIYDIIW
jgi:hypothetical protein